MGERERHFEERQEERKEKTLKDGHMRKRKERNQWTETRCMDEGQTDTWERQGAREREGGEGGVELKTAAARNLLEH